MKARYPFAMLCVVSLTPVGVSAEETTVPASLDIGSSAWQFRFSGLDENGASSAYSTLSPYSRALGAAPGFSALKPSPRDDATGSSSSLELRTPGLNGLFGHLAVLGDDPNSPIDARDVEVAAIYGTGGLFLGAGYRYQPDRSGDSWGVGGGYSLGDLQLSAAYRRSENPDIFGSPDESRPYAGALGLPASIALDSGDGQIVDLGFQYSFGRTRARLGYSRLEGTASAGGSALDLELDRWVIGIDHGIGRDLDVFAEYQYSDGLSNDEPSTDDVFGLGLRHRF